MANNVKKLARGSVALTDTAVYTTPGTGQAVVTNIVLTNTTGTAITATVKLATVDILSGISIAANGVFSFDLRQVLEANNTMSAAASAVGLNIHASGMEITA